MSHRGADLHEAFHPIGSVYATASELPHVAIESMLPSGNLYIGVQYLQPYQTIEASLSRAGSGGYIVPSIRLGYNSRNGSTEIPGILIVPGSHLILSIKASRAGQPDNIHIGDFIAPQPFQAGPNATIKWRN
jgi:hypothetical protein